jgi:hypothetical protein
MPRRERKMKYFETDEPQGSKFWSSTRDPGATGWIFTRIGELRKYLREHPEVPGAYRWWTSGNDDVGQEYYTREELLAQGAGKRVTRGHTVRWGRSRGLGW